MALNLTTVNRERASMPGNNYIKFYSVKNMCYITAESELEYAGFLSLECDPNVTSYKIHPGKNSIEYPDGSIVGTIFDAYIEYEDGATCLCEIKYESDLMKPNAVKQRTAQKAICELYDIEYRILTDKDVFGPKAYYSNMKYLNTLHFNLNNGVAEYQAAIVIDAIRALGGKCKIGDIVDYGINAEEVMDSVCYLIMYGYIHPDIYNQPICYDMEVSYEN